MRVPSWLYRIPEITVFNEISNKFCFILKRFWDQFVSKILQDPGCDQNYKGFKFWTNNSALGTSMVNILSNQQNLSSTMHDETESKRKEEENEMTKKIHKCYTSWLWYRHRHKRHSMMCLVMFYYNNISYK